MRSGRRTDTIAAPWTEPARAPKAAIPVFFVVSLAGIAALVIRDAAQGDRQPRRCKGPATET